MPGGARGVSFLSPGGCSATHLEERSSIAACKSTDVAREAACHPCRGRMLHDPNDAKHPTDPMGFH